MRKVFTVALVLAVAMMFAGAAAYADGSCAVKKTAESASAKSACTAGKTAEAKMTSAENAGCSGHKTGETAMTAAGSCANAKFMAGCDPSFCTPEDCAAWGKMCQAHGENAEVRMMSVKGMTCTGCENSIKAALEKAPGVLEVAKVDHKRGLAVVIVDKTMAKNDDMTTLVTNKGYEAQIIPAVATTGTAAPAAKVSDGAKKSCAATCAKPCDKAKSTETKAGDKSTSTPH
ncbi:MAG TPA: cation transporter [candidate division Zixibacteria bacterium]|nr:heavy-metal-associated domain-containing protein [candidate division Zixibacteria bacterium]MDD4918973.1 cation transporter [candidate division Zixibacteria bacterium]MDM7972910.1 cation transporter [candidate division Zixibacteria bacterium]HPC12180.1 cation transporter [candidate division Zixibacteria bacterium]HPI33499.1 cation transporter [candidate division Zixibacteria bacterium]